MDEKDIKHLESTFTKEVKDIIEDLTYGRIISGSNLVSEITLPDGRKAQIFVNVTTDEDDFV